MTSAYAELHCVSNFSFRRGASRPGELVLQAHALGYSAIAVTDECSMAGVVRAYDATKECPIQLIIGSEFHTVDDFHLVLLATSQAGYAQICRLITKGRMGEDAQGKAIPKGSYQLSRADFESGLTECLALWLPSTHASAIKGTGQMRSQAVWVRNHFPDRAWIAVELHRGPNDASYLKTLRALGKTIGLPLVASGDVHMHVHERRALQDTMTAIRHHCTVADAGHRLFPNGQRHLRSIAELAGIYPAELLHETQCIAERCTFSLKSLEYTYPRELVPEGLTATQHLRNLTEEGLIERWPNGVPEKARTAVEKELALIEHLEYEHFFLTVQEIVAWARNKGGEEGRKPILCQGRGSAANSVVCYALRITEVNPEQIEVLFERFLSIERDEPPDIDVDFEHERREEVIQHVFQKYSRQRAAIAATVITYRSRSAIRDVGKALGLAPDVIERLAKAHTYWDNWERLQQSIAAQGMHVDAGVMQRLCVLVESIKDFPRHLSQHVGGFVISEHPVSELVPMENASMPDRTIIQWDKNDLESLGLLKVDVLALGMLTALRRSFDLLKRAGSGPTAMDQIAQGDAETYKMICRADTIGVFQIESRAQMSMLPRLLPKNYYDLVIEIAIVRPGPIKGGMVHPYLQRRHLQEDQVPYPSKALIPVLKRTRGVPIFQEQVMQIAMVAANFTAGEADALRRAMGAWQRTGKMSLYRDKLLAGMRANHYTEEFCEQIYKQIEGFGEYGFPESHSASFALLAYISSYLKRHHPAAFFAGLVNSQPMGFYQPSQLLEQAKRQGVKVLPVDVTRSEWDCTLEPDARGELAIRLGLRLVRSLRRPQGEAIVAARAEKDFESIDDVAHRASLPKRAIRLLALCGALRSLVANRNVAFWNALGVERLPGMLAGTDAREEQLSLPVPSEWEEVLKDYHQLGLSTGRHPLALLRPQLRKLGIQSRRQLNTIRSGQRVSVCGLVTHLQHPQTAKGVIFGSLEDETGINNVIFWPRVFETYRHRILQTTLMVVSGELQSLDGVIHVVADHVEDYSNMVKTLRRKSRDFH
jgi:error-prone DNA polymerase